MIWFSGCNYLSFIKNLTIMRKIEFRGRNSKNNTWHFGFLDYNPIATGFFIHEVADIPPTMQDPGGDVHSERHEVDPKTIGQYTGAKANFKKEIYEGDILSIFDPTNERSTQAVVVFKLGCFSVCENGDPQNGTQTLLSIHCEEKTITIIGNIHDNPEPLTTPTNA